MPEVTRGNLPSMRIDHQRHANPSQEPSKNLGSGAFSSAQARQSGKREMRFGQGQERGFGLESTVPTHRCPLELLGLLLGQKIEVGERILEGDGPEFADRGLGSPQVALLNRAGEASVCRALRRHRR